MEKTFAVACREYFGFHEGQTLQGFMLELKALTPDDRVYFKNEFAKIGIIVSN
jgi:hypothetical protein